MLNEQRHRLKWTRHSYDKLGPSERLYVTQVSDGMLRAVVTEPPKLAMPGARPLWTLQVDHVPFTVTVFNPDGTSRATEGLGRTPLANEAEQALRRCPTLDEVIDAKMQLVARDAMMGIMAQDTDRPRYMVQAIQIGVLQAARQMATA